MVLYAQFREVFLTKRYLGIAMEYAAGGDMFDFFVRNKAFVNVKVPPSCLPASAGFSCYVPAVLLAH